MPKTYYYNYDFFLLKIRRRDEQVILLIISLSGNLDDKYLFLKKEPIEKFTQYTKLILVPIVKKKKTTVLN